MERKMTRKEESKRRREEKLGIKEWTEEDNNKIGNLVDPYYEL